MTGRAGVDEREQKVREGAAFYMTHRYREVSTNGPYGTAVHVTEDCPGCAAETALTEMAAELASLKDALEQAEDTLAWLEFALGWAVFRENKVDLSGEMKDIRARIAAASAGARDALAASFSSPGETGQAAEHGGRPSASAPTSRRVGEEP